MDRRNSRVVHPVPPQEYLPDLARSSKALDARINAKWAADLPKGA
jgi:hypothetical protein